jgi:hypothetical protein
MMRYLIWFIIVTAVLSLFATPLLAENVEVLYVKGAVNVQKEGDVLWIPAKKGMSLDNNDKVKTSVSSEAGIILNADKKDIITIASDSELIVSDVNKKHIGLSKGKIFALIEGMESASSFQVRTPTAIAGVSGSGMSVETDGSSTVVGCFEDIAYVRGINADGTPMAELVVIDDGFKRVIARFEMPGDSLELTAFDRQGWQKFRDTLREYAQNFRHSQSGASGSGNAAQAIEAIERMQERADDLRFDNKENIFERDEFDRRLDSEKEDEQRQSPSTGGNKKSISG